MVGIRAFLTRKILNWLMQPLPHYEYRLRNNPQRLREHLQQGDVLLVDGNHRVSQIIKYLTQSSWSHSTLYIGDELWQRGGALAEQARHDFGEAGARQLLIEALPHGVVVSPVDKYLDCNLRIARPHRLSAAHRKQILDEAIASLGLAYDLRNVLDLTRYLIPVAIVPDRMRRTALHFGSSKATEVICSSLLGRLFQRVRFPILPTVEELDEPAAPGRPARLGFLQHIFGHESHDAYTGLFHMRHPRLLTPRDFDLSPYFEIIKFNAIAKGDFDYQRIRWADPRQSTPADQPEEPSP